MAEKSSELKKPEKEPCQRFACAIQVCLKNNNFDDNKCQAAIEDMRKCCEKLEKQNIYSFICQGCKHTIENDCEKMSSQLIV